MFAGSCIGVVLLVMSLEFLRRLAQEYDRYIIKRHLQVQAAASAYLSRSGGDEHMPLNDTSDRSSPGVVAAQYSFRPSLLQQAGRATLHMLQFGIAYMIMLLAMYYNGYIIISIVIGAWLGSFIFTWQTINTRYAIDIKELGLN
jgi:copper transporter 1